jgi:hypothetical protein
MEQEKPMNLPNDIRLKIEKSPDKENILLLLARLENDGVAITNDVYAAIVTNPRVHETGGHRIDLARTSRPGRLGALAVERAS